MEKNELYVLSITLSLTVGFNIKTEAKIELKNMQQRIIFFIFIFKKKNVKKIPINNKKIELLSAERIIKINTKDKMR